MNRVRAGGKSKDIEHKHLQYLLMGLLGGARGLSSHLDKSSVFLNEFDRNPFSPPPPTVESFKLFPRLCRCSGPPSLTVNHSRAAKYVLL